MKSLLKRDIAPVTEKAWKLIDAEATELLHTHLSARSVCDLSGPHGWEHAAVNTGRLTLAESQKDQDIAWGTREVLPLVEVRVPFRIAQMELDSVDRGLQNPNLDALEQAARKIATFEERAIYHGFEAAGIAGIREASPHAAITFPKDPAKYSHTIAAAIEQLKAAGVEGPYAAVLDTDRYRTLMQSVEPGFPPARVVEQLLESHAICWSPGIDGGVVVSQRGGDFELTIGQDLSIGYAEHDRDEVELFFTESFTFRVIEGAAAVALN